MLPDHTQRWVVARGRVYPAPKGKPARMLGVAMDITARKQAEVEAARQHEQLAHLSRATMSVNCPAPRPRVEPAAGAILSNAQAA